ncbi:MAG: hypothetical protein SNJ54_11280 [Anaerolineae bacterium]
MFGVLERLFVVEATPERLVLREFPFLAWLFGAALIVGAGNLWLLGGEFSAVAALVVGVGLFAWAQVRTITFDRVTGGCTVDLFAPLRRRRALDLPLVEVRGASLREFDSGHTQIILHFYHRPDMGLSVYSKDIVDWKTPLVEAINAFLSA